VRCASSVLLILALAAAAGCDKDGEPRGTPPAAGWKSPAEKASQVSAGGGGSTSHDAADGGFAGGGDGDGADPHADPHAGLDMGGGQGAGDGADPHAGLDMGGGEEDPEMAAVEPPDPDRPIDESKFLRGRIRADAKVASAIERGAVLFLSAWPIDAASGEVIGSPVAVARLEVGELPIRFDLSERNAMAAGTRFEGDVLIVARVDGDGEARTKEPGDVEGQLRARVPARNLELVLDTALR
jgi:hypothetical protein